MSVTITSNLGVVLDASDEAIEKAAMIIGGMAESYWGKNKGRSIEGNLEKFTKIGTVLFFILALALNVLMNH